MKKCHIPNFISILRIALSLLLLFVMQNTILFLVLYITAGFSDVLDGYLARRLNVQSTLGSKLDSIGDFFFFSALLIYLFSANWDIVNSYMIALVLIFSLRIINILIGYLKYKRLIMIHTIANKASGIVVFLVPLLFIFDLHSLVIVIVVIVLFSSVEELLIILTSGKHRIDLDRRSLFTKK